MSEPKKDLTICRSDEGDGGWSIHVKGEEPDMWLVCGPSEPHEVLGWRKPKLIGD